MKTFWYALKSEYLLVGTNSDYHWIALANCESIQINNKFSGAMLRCNSGALCLSGTTLIHPELGCETLKKLTDLSEVWQENLT